MDTCEVKEILGEDSEAAREKNKGGKTGRKGSMHRAEILVGRRKWEITIDSKPRLDQFYQMSASIAHLHKESTYLTLDAFMF